MLDNPQFQEAVRSYRAAVCRLGTSQNGVPLINSFISLWGARSCRRLGGCKGRCDPRRTLGLGADLPDRPFAEIKRAWQEISGVGMPRAHRGRTDESRRRALFSSLWMSPEPDFDQAVEAINQLLASVLGQPTPATN